MSREGVWLSSFRAGSDAEKPANYETAAEIAFYFATDTGVLYIAKAPKQQPFGGFDEAVWNPVVDVSAFLPANDDLAYDATNHTLVLANIPTEDPGVAGALYSNEGVVTVSAGA